MAKKKVNELTLEERLEQALVPKEEWPYEVPENWCWTYLANITERIKRGKSPKYTEKSNIRVFAQKCNQKDGSITLDKAKYLDETSSKKYLDSDFLQDGDTVINSTGTGTLGRVGSYQTRFSLPNESVVPDSHVTLVRSIGNIESSFLFLFLKMKQNYLETQGVGSTNQKELRPNTISELVLALPPLPEQQRIVDRIESLYSKLDEAKEKVQAVLDESENRKAAILHKAFSGELTEKWRKEKNKENQVIETKKMKDILKDIKYGTSEKSEYKNAGVPVIRIPNIGDGTLDFSDMKFLEYTEISEEQLVKKDDILIIRSNGSKKLVGKCALVDDIQEKMTYASFLIRLRVNEMINPKYIVYFMSSDLARCQLFSKAKSSAGINNINSKEIGDINVRVPSLEEQREIVMQLDKVMEKEKNIKVFISEIMERIETTKQSILSKAFRGDLGTNDISEPSSIELLKEIL